MLLLGPYSELKDLASVQPRWWRLVAPCYANATREPVPLESVPRILSYENETIVFDRETMLSEKKAEVQTRLISSSREIPILYRVILKGGEWKVYDVIIEGVSLVKNYRTQFKEILGRKSPDELLEMLREKVGKAQPG